MHVTLGLSDASRPGELSRDLRDTPATAQAATWQWRSLKNSMPAQALGVRNQRCNEGTWSCWLPEATRNMGMDLMMLAELSHKNKMSV